MGQAQLRWRDYLIEGWALGCFMISAGAFTVLLEAPTSPVHAAIANGDVRRFLIGAAMGATAVALIYSPWGQRSGAHMNPAVTLAFLRLKKISAPDAAAYIVAQFIGGTVGVYVLVGLLGALFTQPPALYVVTVPGSAGIAVAMAAEFGISMLLMCTVLFCSSRPRLAPFTGLIAGTLVCLFITFEAPTSGMSMNPARTFASAFPSHIWTAFWLYVLAPVLGMQSAAALFAHPHEMAQLPSAKLYHTGKAGCAHCAHLSTPTEGSS